MYNGSAETENYGFETILTVRKSHLRANPPRDGEDQEENQKRIFRTHCGPLWVHRCLYRSSSSHFTALDHRCRRALIEAVITKSLTDGDHNWKLSLNSIRRNLHTCASAALL